MKAQLRLVFPLILVLASCSGQRDAAKVDVPRSVGHYGPGASREDVTNAYMAAPVWQTMR